MKMIDLRQAALEEDLRPYDPEDLRLEDDGASGKQILKRTSGHEDLQLEDDGTFGKQIWRRTSGTVSPGTSGRR